MKIGIWILFGILLSVIMLLLLKIYLLRRSAQEIRVGFSDKLSNDTNTLIDISSRDRSMRRLAADINQQLALLRRQELTYRQGNLELTDAITNISHDLRTPLTAVYGYLDLMERADPPEDISRYLRILKERTDTLKQLTEELFSYSAAVSSVSETPFLELTLNTILEETLASYYTSLKECGISPRVTMPTKKITRYLNKNALSRILGNIIGNAVKYSDGDLLVTLSENGEILFSNHAKSLNELQVMRLFDRFYTVETGAKSTGLGLSIARELTQQMGGTIHARYQDEVLDILLSFPEDK